MGGKFGTKATVEVIELVKVVAASIIAEVAKDGFQPTDLAAFLQSDAFTKKLAPVIDDIGLVLPEVTELDVWDDIAIGKEVYGVVQEIIADLKALKK